MSFLSKFLGAMGIMCLLAGEFSMTAFAQDRTLRGVQAAGREISIPEKASNALTPIQRRPLMNKVRLMWDPVEGAVSYQLVILNAPEDSVRNIVHTQNYIFTNGFELNLAKFGDEKKNLYWKVCALNYDGKPIGGFSEIQPITEGGELDPVAPKVTTEFEKMDYFPVYPVFSWVPVSGAMHHEVQIFRDRPTGEKLIRTIMGGEYDIYEDSGYTYPGDYFWRVRGVNEAGAPMSEWSERSYFHIDENTPIAALGDSITHGGGVISVPPGYCMYNWETYSEVPVKNIGCSGNTTQDMLARFDVEVLAFHPKILIIMGGVNDFRGGIPAWVTIQNLQAISDKCWNAGIYPVFATATPVNSDIIALRGMIQVPAWDWKYNQQQVNAWVMSQPYAVDVSGFLTDANGDLRRDLSVDGLHPDAEGKRLMGKAISDYLLKNFPGIAKKRVQK